MDHGRKMPLAELALCGLVAGLHVVAMLLLLASGLAVSAGALMFWFAVPFTRAESAIIVAAGVVVFGVAFAVERLATFLATFLEPATQGAEAQGAERRGFEVKPAGPVRALPVDAKDPDSTDE